MPFNIGEIVRDVGEIHDRNPKAFWGILAGTTSLLLASIACGYSKEELQNVEKVPPVATARAMTEYLEEQVKNKPHVSAFCNEAVILHPIVMYGEQDGAVIGMTVSKMPAVETHWGLQSHIMIVRNLDSVGVAQPKADSQDAMLDELKLKLKMENGEEIGLRFPSCADHPSVVDVLGRELEDVVGVGAEMSGAGVTIVDEDVDGTDGILRWVVNAVEIPGLFDGWED